MFSRNTTKTFLGALLALVFWTGWIGSPRIASAALACPAPYPPVDNSAPCPNNVCLTEPRAPAAPGDIEEVTAAKMCILGKFKDLGVLENLVDFVISMNYTPQICGAMGCVKDPLAASFEDYQVPDIEKLQMEQQEFFAEFPMDEFGIYDVTVRGRLLKETGEYQPLEEIHRQIQRVDVPHFTVTAAAEAGSKVSRKASEADKQAACRAYANNNQDRRAYNICNAHHFVSINEAGAPTFKSEKISLCVSSHGDHDEAGSIVSAHYSNRVIDDSVSPNRMILIDRDNPLTLTSDQDFCPGGTVINFPVAHGRNQVELQVNNITGVTGHISLDEFLVDQKGPEMCIRYVDGNGHDIPNVDGKTLLYKELEERVGPFYVDVVLKPCGHLGPAEILTARTRCSQLPPTLPAQGMGNVGDNDISVSAYRDFSDHRICMRQNENSYGPDRKPIYYPMTPVLIGNETHYRAGLDLDMLAFHINTVTINTEDALENKSEKTSSFAFGDVRPLLDGQDKLNVARSMAPKAFAGFIPKSFIQGKELRDAIHKALNSTADSQKLKKDLFMKFLEPVRPLQEELACPNTSLDNLRTIKFYGLEIGDITIPTLDLLNYNQVRLQIEIRGLKGRGEIFKLQFDDNLAGQEMPGHIIEDECSPITTMKILPVRLTGETLRMNLDAHISQNNGKWHIDLHNTNNHFLLDVLGATGRFIEADCAKNQFETRDGDGSEIPWDQATCDAFKNKDAGLKGKAGKNKDTTTCVSKSDSLDTQIRDHISNLIQCNLPIQLETKLNNQDEKAKLTDFSFDLLGNKLRFDLFSPLSQFQLNIDGGGIGFSGSSLLTTAGADERITNSATFIESLPQAFSPDQLKNNWKDKFGAVFEHDDNPSINPVDVASEMDRMVNFSLKEELVNSILHSAGLYLWDQARLDGEEHQLLDLDVVNLRSILKLGAKDAGDNDPCLTRDKKRQLTDKDEDGNLLDGTYKCFPFPLNIQRLFNDQLQYDFDGRNGFEKGKDTLQPLLIRTSLSPFAPPTVKLVKTTPYDIKNGQPGVIQLDLEIGLRDARMAFFVEETDWNADPVQCKTDDTGRCLIKDFCAGDDHQCVLLPDDHKKTPLVVYSVTGKVGLSAYLDLRDVDGSGVIHVEAGITSLNNGPGKYKRDTDATYLKVSTIRNNTYLSDFKMSDEFQKILPLLLDNYLFQDPTDIRVEIPVAVPTAKKDSMLDELFETFDLPKMGIDNLWLADPVASVTAPNLGPTRYLGFGTDIVINKTVTGGVRLDFPNSFQEIGRVKPNDPVRQDVSIFNWTNILGF